jgi:hypothetical protein
VSSARSWRSLATLAAIAASTSSRPRSVANDDAARSSDRWRATSLAALGRSRCRDPGRREHEACPAWSGEAVGWPGHAQRAQHADLAPVEPELLEDRLLAQRHVAPEPRQARGHLRPAEVEVGEQLRQPAEDVVGEILGHSNILLAIQLSRMYLIRDT